MIDEKIFLGFPIEFKDICQIYPPTVNDVCGDKDFFIYQSLFTMTQEDLEDAYSKENIDDIPTPFQYLMISCYQNEEMMEKVKDGFKKFVHEPVTIIPEIEMLLIGKEEEDIDPDVDLDNPRLITAENFFDFQNCIRIAMGENTVKPPETPDPNEDPRITRWKRKVREHDRIVKKKKNKNGPTFGTLLAAICCMGIGITPLNIGEISYACVQWLVAIEQQKEEYDINIRALLAGADSKKVKPKYWIKNIDKEEL